jgi:hypothetical protein
MAFTLARILSTLIAIALGATMAYAILRLLLHVRLAKLARLGRTRIDVPATFAWHSVGAYRFLKLLFGRGLRETNDIYVSIVGGLLRFALITMVLASAAAFAIIVADKPR